MKKIIFSLAVSLIISLKSFAVEEKPHMIRTFDGSKTNRIEVKTSGGYISLIGGNEANARVEVYVKGNNWKGKNLSTEEITEKLKQYTLSVTQKGNVLECIAKNNNKENSDLSISFKVFCPKNLDTDLNTSGGSISLKQLQGDINFKTSGGSLDLIDLDGKLLGKTSGGSIHLENCHKNIKLETSGGSVNAKNCSGEITIKTAGGSFNLDQMKGKISAITSGGSINADNINGSFSAKTSGGSINADITHVDGEIKLETSAGSINLKLPENEGMDLALEGNKIKYASLNNFKGKTTSKNLQGTVNGGGHKVSAYTSSGSVSVDF